MLNKLAKGFRFLFIYGTIISLLFISKEKCTYAQEISFIQDEACACGAKFIDPETPHCTQLCDNYGPLNESSIYLVLPMKFSPADLDKNNSIMAYDLKSFVVTRSPYDSNKLYNTKMSYYPSVSDTLNESHLYLNFLVVGNNIALVQLGKSLSPKFTLGLTELVTGLKSTNKIKFDLTPYFQEKFNASENKLQIEHLNIIFSQLVASFTYDHVRSEVVPNPLLSKSYFANQLIPYVNTTAEVYSSDVFLQAISPGWRPTEKTNHSLEQFRKEFPKLEKNDSTAPSSNMKLVLTAFSENHSYTLPTVLEQLEEPWSSWTVAEAFTPFSLPQFFNLPKKLQPNRELSYNTEGNSNVLKNSAASFSHMGVLLKSVGWKCPSRQLSIIAETQTLNFDMSYVFYGIPVKSELSAFEVVSIKQLKGRAYIYQKKNKLFIDDFSKYSKTQKFYYASGNEEFQLIPSEACGLFR
ncbi:MAG: hypothetical protein QE271_02955 [Bacteriovoracaceae bacterium]|nr:hypothetical protein [Bacteriovoracaceae bacterium]